MSCGASGLKKTSSFAALAPSRFTFSTVQPSRSVVSRQFPFFSYPEVSRATMRPVRPGRTKRLIAGPTPYSGSRRYPLAWGASHSVTPSFTASISAYDAAFGSSGWSIFCRLPRWSIAIIVKRPVSFEICWRPRSLPTEIRTGTTPTVREKGGAELTFDSAHDGDTFGGSEVIDQGGNYISGPTNLALRVTCPTASRPRFFLLPSLSSFTCPRRLRTPGPARNSVLTPGFPLSRHRCPRL